MNHDSVRDFRAWIVNHLIQFGTSERTDIPVRNDGSQIFWFKSRFQIAYRESFESDRELKWGTANHLIYVGHSRITNHLIPRFLCGFVNHLNHDSRVALRLTRWIANLLIQFGTSDRVSGIIWFILLIKWFTIHDPSPDLKWWIPNHLIQTETSEWVRESFWKLNGSRSELRVLI